MSIRLEQLTKIYNPETDFPVTAVNDAPVAADDRPGLIFDGVDDFVQLGSDSSLEMTTAMTM